MILYYQPPPTKHSVNESKWSKMCCVYFYNHKWLECLMIIDFIMKCFEMCFVYFSNDMCLFICWKRRPVFVVGRSKTCSVDESKWFGWAWASTRHIPPACPGSQNLGHLPSNSKRLQIGEHKKSSREMVIWRLMFCLWPRQAQKR